MIFFCNHYYVDRSKQVADNVGVGLNSHSLFRLGRKCKWLTITAAIYSIMQGGRGCI
jgi:hypothetical protein